MRRNDLIRTVPFCWTHELAIEERYIDEKRGIYKQYTPSMTVTDQQAVKTGS
jgi:hypothetical protein